MAQLDRASDYESGCRRFESCWAHQYIQGLSRIRLSPFFYLLPCCCPQRILLVTTTELPSCRFLEEMVSVLIVVPCGTVRIHIAQGVGHCAIREAHDVPFTSASRMISKLHTARATNSFEMQIAKLIDCDLLIINDFGLKPFTGIQDEDFHEVISECYERRSTIVTSNLDVPEWPDAFPNRILGSATIDRLRHGAYKIVLAGMNYWTAADKPG